MPGHCFFSWLLLLMFVFFVSVLCFFHSHPSLLSVRLTFEIRVSTSNLILSCGPISRSLAFYQPIGKYTCIPISYTHNGHKSISETSLFSPYDLAYRHKSTHNFFSLGLMAISQAINLVIRSSVGSIFLLFYRGCLLFIFMGVRTPYSWLECLELHKYYLSFSLMLHIIHLYPHLII